MNNECGYFEVDLKTFNHSKICIIEEDLIYECSLWMTATGRLCALHNRFIRRVTVVGSLNKVFDNLL